MRKTTKLFLGFTAGLLLLCGCSAAEEKLGYENADVAKEALASASSVRMRCDLDNVDASGNIYADEKAAAYMKNSGLFDQGNKLITQRRQDVFDRLWKNNRFHNGSLAET